MRPQNHQVNLLAREGNPRVAARLWVRQGKISQWLSGRIRSAEAEMLRRLALEEPETPEQLEWIRPVDDAELQGIACTGTA